MPTRHRGPILVTGSHRSGSTWVGQMLASHPRVDYVSEPFNIQYPHPHSPVKHWFHHVTPDEEPAFRTYLAPLLEYRYSWWEDFRSRPSLRRLAGASRRTLRAHWRRLTGCRPLMKDPIALFSAEWLACTYDMDVILLVRHPAAFASSLKRLNWRFGFYHFWIQPRLMEQYLSAFTDDIRRAWETPGDVIDEAILFWRIAHHVIRQYQQRHPDWVCVRHEDLSARPVEEYGKLFARLGLELNAKVRAVIEEHTSRKNPGEAPAAVVHQLKRDSRANIANWVNRLTPDEIDRIRRGTADVAQHFYTDADWTLGRKQSA